MIKVTILTLILLVFYSIGFASDKYIFAVFDFEAENFSESQNKIVTEKLSSYLIEFGFDIVERTQLETIAEEHAIQMSGLTDESTIATFGKLLNATHIFTGLIYNSDTKFSSSIKVIDIETGKIFVSISDECECNFEEFLNSCLRNQASLIRDEVVHQLLKEQKKENELLIAATEGNLNKVIELVNQGVDINSSDGGGYTALHRATAEGEIDVIRFLIEKGAKVKVLTDDGLTPLELSTKNGYIDCFKYLFKYDSDIDHTDSYGCNALHWAVQYENYDAVKFISSNFPQLLNSKSYKGFTPLIFALRRNNIPIFKMLHQAGADIHYKSDLNASIFSLAILTSEPKFVRFLINYVDTKAETVVVNDKKISLFVWSVFQDRTELIDIFLENGYQIDEIGQLGVTPLFWAVYRDQVDFAKALINRGANVNFTNKKGYSLLMVAAVNGNIEIVKSLVNKGANIYHSTPDGTTAKELARLKKNIEVYSYLKSL